MAANTKGPYELRIPYVADDFIGHTLRLNLMVAGSTAPTPGTPAEDVLVVTRSSSIPLPDAVDSFWDVARERLSTGTAASGYELWRIPTEGGDPIFITAGDLTNINGNGGLLVKNSQEVYTFRSANGGIGKITLMDVASNSETRAPIPSANTLGQFAISADSFLLARDDGFFIAKMNLSSGQNEVSFKRRNRK